MSEEKFYNRVRESLSGYAPEVPDNVYAGMRRKLWMSRFTQFDPARLNMWYLLLALGAGSAWAYSTTSTKEVSAIKSSGFEVSLVPVKAIPADHQLTIEPESNDAGHSLYTSIKS